MDKGSFALVALSFDFAKSELGGEFAEFGFQALDRLKGGYRMALEQVPDRDAEFSGYGHGCFVATATRRETETPLLERVVHLEELLGRLDQERADRSFAMPLESGAAFEVPALAYTRIKSKVGDQFLTVREATDVPDGGA